MKITFEAEIKKTESKTTVSGDKEYRLALATEDAQLMQLSILPADKTVRVTVEQI